MFIEPIFKRRKYPVLIECMDHIARVQHYLIRYPERQASGIAYLFYFPIKLDSEPVPPIEMVALQQNNFIIVVYEPIIEPVTELELPFRAYHFCYGSLLPNPEFGHR